MKPIVVAIYISPTVGGSMRSVPEVEAVAGIGLRGDRYAIGTGSFSKNKQEESQVTLINGMFFEGSGFDYTDSRRNIVTWDVELMGLIGRTFQIGTALFRGIEYCDPCNRPSNLCDKEGFKKAFFDRGGLRADILRGGIIKVRDLITLHKKEC